MSSKTRLKRIYIPMWLADAEVIAVWKAQAGFDYEVLSHQDRYDENRGGWSSRQITEGRIRWEPRIGRMRRTYNNITAPALEEDAGLRRSLGKFNLGAAEPYHKDVADEAFIRLPDRTSEDAWPDTFPSFQNAAAEECRQAISASHIREYHWSPEYSDINWTLFLLPVFSTYYLDDDQVPIPVFIHGQTGKFSGSRRASMKRGHRTALILL